MVGSMNVKILLGCCSVVAAFGLVGACGGSDEDDSSSTGGKGGSDSGTGGSTGGSSGASTGGSSTGGTAGSSTGGASGGTAGAATGGAAGAATGGTAGAGTGGSSATCPTDAPQSGSNCADSGLSCTFPGQNGNTQQCACFDGEWDCDPCPTDEPQNNDPCQSGPIGGSQCVYGTNQCVCGGGDWDCATCPTAAPADNDDCTLNNQQCAYTGTECTCQGFGTDLQWNCDTPGGPGNGCPATQPAPGSACAGSPLDPPCDYGQGNSCICAGQQWFCN